VVAVEAAHLVALEGPADTARLRVEVPEQGSVPGVQREESTTSGRYVVHVHAEVHQVAVHQGRRLDLVALGLEAAQPRRVAEIVHAPRARREAPDLLAAGGVEGVEDLPGADEDALRPVDLAHVDRGCGRESRARLLVGEEAPELAAVGEADGVDVAVPGQDVDHADQALRGDVDEGDARGGRDGAVGRELPAHAQVPGVVGCEEQLVGIEEQPSRSTPVARPLGGLEVPRDEGDAVGKGEPAENRLGRKGLAVLVEADAAKAAVGARARGDEGGLQVEVGEVQRALAVHRQALGAASGLGEVERRLFGPRLHQDADESSVGVELRDAAEQHARHVPVSAGGARDARGREDEAIVDEDLAVHAVCVGQR
jgi:hypothetical protein